MQAQQQQTWAKYWGLAPFWGGGLLFKLLFCHEVMLSLSGTECIVRTSDVNEMYVKHAENQAVHALQAYVT